MWSLFDPIHMKSMTKIEKPEINPSSSVGVMVFYNPGDTRMCCSKVMNEMYLVQWLAIPYIPLYLSKIRSLIPIFQKRPRNTHGKQDFDRLFSSDPFLSPLIFQQNPFPNPLLLDPHRHTPAPTT